MLKLAKIAFKGAKKKGKKRPPKKSEVIDIESWKPTRDPRKEGTRMSAIFTDFLENLLVKDDKLKLD